MIDPNYDKLEYWLRGPQYDPSNPWRDWSKNGLFPFPMKEGKSGIKIIDPKPHYIMYGPYNYHNAIRYNYNSLEHDAKPKLPQLGEEFTIEFNGMSETRPLTSFRWEFLIGTTWDLDNPKWLICTTSERYLRFTCTDVFSTFVCIDSAPDVLPLGEDYKIAVTRHNGIVRIYVNGNKVTQGMCDNDITGIHQFQVGGQSEGNFGTNMMKGKVYSAKIYNGIAKYTGDSYSLDEPEYSPSYIPATIPYQYQYRGTHKLAGTVKVQGVIDPNAEVFLFSEDENIPLASLQTDAQGKFEFLNLNNAYKYYVLAKTSIGSWEHIVSSKRTPG